MNIKFNLVTVSPFRIDPTEIYDVYDDVTLNPRIKAVN